MGVHLEFSGWVFISLETLNKIKNRDAVGRRTSVRLTILNRNKTPFTFRNSEILPIFLPVQ